MLAHGRLTLALAAAAAIGLAGGFLLGRRSGPIPSPATPPTSPTTGVPAPADPAPEPSPPTAATADPDDSPEVSEPSREPDTPEPPAGSPQALEAEIARLNDEVARLRAQVARLQAQLDHGQPLRTAQRQAIREKHYRYGDLYEEFLDYFLDPELVTSHTADLLALVDRLARAADLAAHPLLADQGWHEDERGWQVRLEDAGGSMQVRTGHTTLSHAGGQPPPIPGVSLAIDLELPPLPDPAGWKNRSVDQGSVRIELTSYEGGGLWVEIGVHAENRPAGADLGLRWEWPDEGYLSMSPWRGDDFFSQDENDPILREQAATFRAFLQRSPFVPR